MSTEIQITNRNPFTAKKIKAKLLDSGDADPFMEFIIGPGEAVIIPMGEGMSLTLAEELRPLTEASAANSGAAEEIS